MPALSSPPAIISPAPHDTLETLSFGPNGTALVKDYNTGDFKLVFEPIMDLSFSRLENLPEPVQIKLSRVHFNEIVRKFETLMQGNGDRTLECVLGIADLHRDSDQITFFRKWGLAPQTEAAPGATLKTGWQFIRIDLKTMAVETLNGRAYMKDGRLHSEVLRSNYQGTIDTTFMDEYRQHNSP